MTSAVKGSAMVGVIQREVRGIGSTEGVVKGVGSSRGTVIKSAWIE